MKHARPVHMENMHMLCCDSVKTCGPASLDREGFGSVCMCSMCMWENTRSICEVVWSLLSGCLLGAVQAVGLHCFVVANSHPGPQRTARDGTLYS